MKKAPYNIIRSNRKTIAFVIDRGGNFTVRAPRDATIAEIEQLVEEKRSWIEEKQQLVASLRQKYQPVEVRQGGVVPYLGTLLSITMANIEKPAIVGSPPSEDTLSQSVPTGGTLMLPLHYTEVELKLYFKELAKAFIFPRVRDLASRLSLRHGDLRLSDARARWGSCGAHNSQNFSWRLVMAPQELVDYVIIHELCHIKHKNHSPAFWAEVEKHMPDYRERARELKESRELLNLLP